MKNINLHPKGDSLPIPQMTLVSINVQAIHDPATKKDYITFLGMTVTKRFSIDKPVTSKIEGLYNEWFCSKYLTRSSY